MSAVSRPSNSKTRRRLAAWLAFGATGLATGAVWATGFASVSAGNGTTGESPAMAKTAPSTASSDLNGKATAVDPIAFDWDGRWGKITAPKVMFKVDLSGAAYNGTRRYNIALLLSNTSALTGWASLQLEFEQVQLAANGTCDAADFDGNQNAKVLNVDDQDAGVYWNSLVGDKVYCLGIFTSDGDDFAGTFLRAAQDTAPTDFPSFITTVDRAA
jgi:hypothetical protein